MKQKAESAVQIELYKCHHCAGVANILIRKHTKKGTWPEIEFCPFCGLSNRYPREFDNEHDTLLNENNYDQA